MSYRVDSSMVRKMADHLDREETYDTMHQMSASLSKEAGRLGKSETELILSLAADVRDPIFWRKLDILFAHRFD